MGGLSSALGEGMAGWRWGADESCVFGNSTLSTQQGLDGRQHLLIMLRPPAA